MFTSNCETVEAIIAAVESFGAALKRVRVREEMTGPEIARNALGPDSKALARRDFANYLSKIENDKVPNVGLRRLRLIAKGFGFDSLGAFFNELEAHPIDTENYKEPSGALGVPPHTSPGVGHADRPVRIGGGVVSDEIHEIRSALAAVGKILLAAGISGAREPDAARGAVATGRSAAHQRTPRKSP